MKQATQIARHFSTAFVMVAGLTAGSAAFAQTVSADLKPTAGNNAAGTVRFTQAGNKVRVEGDLKGLKPDAEHGFHVHEKGDCSAPDAMSAGGHFNPGGKPHAHHSKPDRHAGDMPNVKADAKGNAKISYETDQLSTGSGANSVVGKAVVVHRDPDDYSSQPAGNSGPRVACGVVAPK
jgi:superoxide dismutase, Cu-Zn family